MITIENQVWTFVTTSNGELSFTNCGIWRIPDCTGIASGTNETVEFPDGIRDGSIVLIDATGTITVQPGPDLALALSTGLALAFTLCGSFIVIRKLWLVFTTTAGIPHQSDN